MGVCSYCSTYRSVEWGGECYSWSEARACSKITGPDDPEYKRRKREHDKYRANLLNAEARRVEREAASRVAGLRAEARSLLKEP
jgi:hypothetical protein